MKLTRSEAECLLASIDLIWDPETCRERFKGRDRATFWRAVAKLRSVVAGEKRESGGSIPPEMRTAVELSGKIRDLAALDSPVLNKSGGSEGPPREGLLYWDRADRPGHFGGLVPGTRDPADGEGLALGVNKSGGSDVCALCDGTKQVESDEGPMVRCPNCEGDA